MPRPICQILNRLFAIHYRSLAMYLVWATPHRQRGDERASQTIREIVADQKELSARIAELIDERGCKIDMGDFPITFTGSHDLDLKYLMRRLVDFQKGTVASLEACYTELADDPVAQSLADECLGAAKGHLETLEDVVAGRSQPVGDTELKLHVAAVAPAPAH